MEKIQKIDSLPNESKIFVKDHMTDFEKLLIANSLIKQLKKEIASLSFELGVVNSEKQELEDKVKKLTSKSKKRLKKEIIYLKNLLIKNNIKIEQI